MDIKISITTIQGDNINITWKDDKTLIAVINEQTIKIENCDSLPHALNLLRYFEVSKKFALITQ